MIKENVIQIESGIMIRVDMSAKKIRYVKNTSFGILLHLVVKMVKYLASIFDHEIINLSNYRQITIKL